MQLTSLLAEKLFYLLPRDKNYTYSPYSLAKVLQLLYHGADGETRQEIIDFLHSQLPTLPQFSNLDEVNDIWVDKRTILKAEFENILTTNNISTHSLDFNNSSEACQVINKHIAKHTNDKIPQLISSLSNDTRLVLTNTIYFNKDWETPFLQEDSELKAFHNLNGQSSDVMTMRNTEYFGYGKNEQVQVLRLPYQDSDFAMLIILPKNKQQFRTIQYQGINSNLISQWQSIVNMEDNYKINVELPKFNIDFELAGLISYFSMTGLPITFGETPNFSNMTDELAISEMIHKSSIEVSETGTVAVASTFVEMYLMGEEFTEPEPTIDFIANRPFFFMIEDIKSMEVLFFGQVVEL